LNSQKSLAIAIQGVRASFHDVAAQKVFAGHVMHAVECRLND